MHLDQFNQYIKRIKLRRDDIPSNDEYPFCLPAIESLTELPLHPQVTYCR